MRFLVNGSIAFDLLLSHDGSFLTGIDPKNLERLSVSFVTEGFVRHHGGTAANIAWNIALLGATPLVIGSVGSDGASYVELLRERGVETRYIEQRNDAVTSMAIIAGDSHERQISFFHPGADAVATFPDLSDEREDIAYAMMSPRNPLLMLSGARECVRLKIPYLFDPGQRVYVFSDDEFKRMVTESAGLVVNEYEWGLASKVLHWDEKRVVDACGLLVITLGEKGLRLITKKEDVTVPACTAERFVNPTGAGDAVRAGLLYGLAKKWSLKDTGRLCAILGCLVVEQEGTLLDHLDMDEVQARAEESYGEQLPKM